MIRTFSGTHEFHPTVLDDTDAVVEGNADEIVESILNGVCPRCEGPLPSLPEHPAGSRITACRTIPVCGRCGVDEAYEAATNGIVSDAGCWPLEVEVIEERRRRVEANSTLVTATLVDGKLITGDGVITPSLRLHPGGWAEFGDRTER